MKICTNCGFVLTPALEKVWNNNPELSNICPSIKCGLSTLIDVDEAIAPIICELNRKGYKTEFSCAGHIYEYAVMPYVSFDHENNETGIPSFEKLAELGKYHWYFDVESYTGWGNYVIRYAPYFDTSNIAIARIEQAYAMDELQAWVNTLPEATWADDDLTIMCRPSHEDLMKLAKIQDKWLEWDETRPGILKPIDKLARVTSGWKPVDIRMILVHACVYTSRLME